MPPRKVKIFKPYLDPLKHLEHLKAIRENAQNEYDMALAEEYEEEGEEEMGDEEQYMFSLSEGDPPMTLGRIDLSFPETKEEFENSPFCYPPSYYTLSPKERLILLFAENFRRQFVINNPKRRALVLAVPNECNVQKFVSTTIRPTAFLHIPLIRNLEGIASFVADFILYEPLDDMMGFPNRLVSPSTLLRRRRGNSFEMATLLCSMLIGAGFPALVVSGVARAETVLNDQRSEPYPHKIVEIETEEVEKVKERTGQKYKLRPMPDLESHLEEAVTELLKQKALEDQAARDEVLRLEMEALELLAVDRYHYRRSHAWVLVLDNAPWSIKPRITYTDENGDVIDAPPTPRFIEPSTGTICDTHCKKYILIDSIWNNQNYWVNRQITQRIDEIRWDLGNMDDWEHLLPGQPPEMRVHKKFSVENIMPEQGVDSSLMEEKCLDFVRSWVMPLHIGQKEFEERFPKLHKTVHYKGCIHERYAPYSQRDGKTMQLTLFADDEYKEETMRWSFFENRADKLLQIKYNHHTGIFEETFGKGRNDSLRFYKYSMDPNQPKYLYFYAEPRIDSLKALEVFPDHIILNYVNRTDRCYYLEFEFRQIGHSLKKIVEKFTRNPDPNVRADDDIAVRIFQLLQGKIILKFHYADGALTASTREFIKPPRPDYGEELKFDPSLTKGYKSNVNEPDPTSLELYQLLLAQLKYEQKIEKQFEKITEDINCILAQRRSEMLNPVLKFHIYDSLRNGAARSIRLQQYEAEQELKREMASKPPDFLAPYLVPYKGQELTHDESWAAYNACLNDLKSRFVGLLNELQRQYEDLTTEAQSLQRFLNRFEDQFNNYDYERLVNEARAIVLNKRMVQQRLTLTHEESQKKYEFVKESLRKDPRLNLNLSEAE